MRAERIDEPQGEYTTMYNYTIDEIRQAGIYAIDNSINGMRYIGRTRNSFRTRWTSHKNDLRNRTHPNKQMLHDWIAMGESAFTFSIVRVFTRDELSLGGYELTQIEWSYISQIDPRLCYNAGSESMPAIDRVSVPTKVQRIALEKGETIISLHYKTKIPHHILADMWRIGCHKRGNMQYNLLIANALEVRTLDLLIED